MDWNFVTFLFERYFATCDDVWLYELRVCGLSEIQIERGIIAGWLQLYKDGYAPEPPLTLIHQYDWNLSEVVWDLEDFNVNPRSH